ncbi:MAG: 3-deoxy-manno-octulosonate cytidylyltransferase [Robiginitomaculum sp.]|nr:3-deoxy-manno-octulosonate cytidylyltransferase [Robiginitomaculum sp.]
MKTCIVIPARMASHRLPGKPLADIAGVPMVLRVAEAARAAGFGEPLIAAGDLEIADCARANGYQVVLTPAELPSGTDRVQAALALANIADDVQCVVNLQGDLPDIDPAAIRQVVAVLAKVETAAIATLVAKISTDDERNNPDVVKAILSPLATTDPNFAKRLFRAIYFTRAMAPTGPGPLYQHIGIYAYRREALDKFTALPPTPLEVREKLEQLRAIENQMQIAVGLVDQIPQGVDSPADLALIQAKFTNPAS